MRHKIPNASLYKMRVNELLSDRLLIYKARKKDKKAFSKLYLKHVDSIYRYVFFRVNQSQNQAEDITQEVFFKAWNKIDSLKNEKLNFKAWIFRIAHNLVIDFYKLNKNENKLNPNIPDENKLDDEIIQKIENEDLLRAIEKLNDEQKEVIVMKFIEGFSNKEICEVVKKNEAAVRAIQHRALKKLKNLINKI